MSSAKERKDKKKKDDEKDKKTNATKTKKVTKSKKSSTKNTLKKIFKFGAAKTDIKKSIAFGDWLESYTSGSKKVNVEQLKAGPETNFQDDDVTVFVSPFDILHTIAPRLFQAEVGPTPEVVLTPECSLKCTINVGIGPGH